MTPEPVTTEEMDAAAHAAFVTLQARLRSRGTELPDAMMGAFTCGFAHGTQYLFDLLKEREVL